MIDERRYLMISSEEYEYIKKQFNKKGRKLADKIMSFRDFTHWKYEISMPLLIADAKQLFESMTLTENYEFIQDKSLSEWPENPEPIQFIARINLLDVSKSRIKAMVITDCPLISKTSDIKHVGRHVFEYTEENGIKIVPANKDRMSDYNESMKMCHVFMTTLIYKLYTESTGIGYKALYKLGPNVIYLNQTQMRDVLEESESYDKEMFLLADYPLKELTIVSEGMFHSSYYNNKEFYGIQHIYCTVLHNDDTLWQVNIKVYIETTISPRYIYVAADVTGLKGDTENEIEIKIFEDNIKIDDTLRMESKELYDTNIQEYLEKNFITQKQTIITQYVLVFQYIMYCMAKPKKTILREVKESKKNPTKRQSHQKLHDEVTVLIKNTGYIAPRKSIINPGSGSKHSYEYERRGGWCVRHKTGKRYFRKGATCCKGRGNKATHVYELRSEDNEESN